MQVFSSLRTEGPRNPPALGSSLAPDAGNSKVPHFPYFISLKAPPDTSDQELRLARIFLPRPLSAGRSSPDSFPSASSEVFGKHLLQTCLRPVPQDNFFLLLPVPLPSRRVFLNLYPCGSLLEGKDFFFFFNWFTYTLVHTFIHLCDLQHLLSSDCVSVSVLKIGDTERHLAGSVGTT